MVFILLALCSCKRHNEIAALPIDKLYILEWNSWTYPALYVVGFSELDKNFNVKCARAISYKSSNYNQFEHTVSDSLRSKISNILLKYQTDTIFSFPEDEDWIYDGNHYHFILQKDNQKSISISFIPRYLPDDLKFVYSYLYGSREKGEIEETVHKGTYDELFNLFESEIQKNLRPTIKFTPPL